jgi:hypothetical protein
MAEEVTKTIENVDRLFPEIVVNGESHISENYVPPVVIEQVVPQQTQEEETQTNTPAQNTQGEDVYAVELNEVLHDFSDRDLTQSLANEVSARQSADGNLQQSIDNVAGTVNGITAKIPNQASSENQLADKNFVNSSIATNTANFLGTYTSLADIEAIQNPTNNDYAFLETTDSAGNTLYDRYKYNAEDDEWLFEYELNNSGFTAEQWATINSGLTQSSVNQAITDAIAGIAVPTKAVVSTSKTETPQGDMIYFVDTASITLTLAFGSEEKVTAEVHALADCTVSYYTDSTTSASLGMLAGTTAKFIYFNGWKFNGIYGAVWN